MRINLRIILREVKAAIPKAACWGGGDFVYFAPFVPHQEINLDPGAALGLVLVRSGHEGIFVDLDVIETS